MNPTSLAAFLEDLPGVEDLAQTFLGFDPWADQENGWWMDLESQRLAVLPLTYPPAYDLLCLWLASASGIFEEGSDWCVDVAWTGEAFMITTNTNDGKLRTASYVSAPENWLAIQLGADVVPALNEMDPTDEFLAALTVAEHLSMKSFIFRTVHKEATGG